MKPGHLALLCDLGEVAEPLWASVFSFKKTQTPTWKCNCRDQSRESCKKTEGPHTHDGLCEQSLSLPDSFQRFYKENYNIVDTF